MAQSREQLREVAKRMKERGYNDDEIVTALKNLAQTPSETTTSESIPISEPIQEPIQNIQKPTETPTFKFPFIEETKEASERGERISPFSMFSSGIEFPALREKLQTRDTEHPYSALAKRTGQFGLSVLEGATSPASILGAVAGGFPQTRSLVKKGLQKIAPGISQRLGLDSPIADFATEIGKKSGKVKLKVQGDTITDEATGAIYKQQSDGSMVNVLTGDIVDTKTGRVTSPSSSTSSTSQISPELAVQEPTQIYLPRDLKGAKPRFNIGSNSYSPQFESDLDKAFYIISQTNPSKKDKDYLDFVMRYTGLSEKDARIKGAEIRSKIKSLVSGQEAGDVKIPKLFDGEVINLPNSKGTVLHLNLPPARPSDSLSPNNITRSSTGLTPPIKVVEPASESLLNPVLRSRLHKALDPAQGGAEKLGQADIDQLTAYVWKNPKLAPEEQTQASIALLKMIDGGAPLDAEMNALRKVMTDDILTLMTHNREAFKKGSMFHEVVNLPRSLMSTMDLSAPFRQGLGAINTQAWWKSWGPMLRALGSEQYYHKAMDEILSRPNHISKITESGKLAKSFSEEAGLNLSTLGHITTREEVMLSSLAEKIPGWGRVVRGSNRAMTLFLNKVRADNFDNLINQGEKLSQTALETGKVRRGLLFSEKFSPEDAQLLNPRNNLELARNLAGFVNASTGRGNLGALEKNAIGLADVLFSPRLIASRLQYMNPKNYIFTDPMIRKQYVKSLMGIATTWISMAGLAKGAGAEVILDSTNSDFGKMKFGNTRLDPAGGFQQYLVLAARIAAGEFTGATSGRSSQMGTGFGTKDRFDAAADFGVNKLAPIMSYIVGAMRDSDGRPFEMADEAAKRFIPIFAQDLMELIEEDPSLFALAPLAATGMGTQSFGNRDESSRILPKITLGGIPEDYEDIRPRDIKFPIRR